jgi:hypothetical protein
MFTPFTFDAMLLSAHAAYSVACGAATVAVFVIVVVEVTTGVDFDVVKTASVTVVVVSARGWLVNVVTDVSITVLVTTEVGARMVSVELAVFVRVVVVTITTSPAHLTAFLGLRTNIILTVYEQ